MFRTGVSPVRSALALARWVPGRNPNRTLPLTQLVTRDRHFFFVPRVRGDDRQLFVQRNFSLSYSFASGAPSSSSDDNNGSGSDPENPDDATPMPVTPAGTPAGVLATQTVPEVWPTVPVIAVNRHPVFPKFIKIVEVSDEALVSLLRRKVRLNQPYAGVFVKRADDDEREVASTVEDLYPVGTFVQIVEMQDLGNRLRMVVMGHRRISLSGPAAESTAEPAAEEVGKGEKAEELTSPKESRLLMADTENLPKETFEVTDEMKALTQEVIKTIRDIIVSNIKLQIRSVCSLTVSFGRL